MTDLEKICPNAAHPLSIWSGPHEKMQWLWLTSAETISNAGRFFQRKCIGLPHSGHRFIFFSLMFGEKSSLGGTIYRVNTLTWVKGHTNIMLNCKWYRAKEIYVYISPSVWSVFIQAHSIDELVGATHRAPIDINHYAFPLTILAIQFHSAFYPIITTQCFFKM